MKKILIVNKALSTGGIESALVNMANELCQLYQIDLLVFDPTGPMKDQLCDDVRLLPVSWRINALGMPLKRALKTGNIAIILFRLWATVWTKLVNNSMPIEIALQHQEKLTGYDLAISFHQEMGKHTVASGFSRIVDRCVEAKKKIAWLHYDSDALDLDSDYNNPFYMKMDKIICVSRSLRDSYDEKFPMFKGKTEYCYNFIDYLSLHQKSVQRQVVEYPAGKLICFSACRLAKEKALVRAIECLSPVFTEHREIMWYIAGEGPEQENIEQVIKNNGLGSQIKLLGNLDNPYPYMRNADLLMNLSYHEAAPMVFLEAKALGVPVFATETSSAKELLEEPVCSFICENTEKGIYEEFRYLAENPDKIVEAKAMLKGYCGNNLQSLMKFEEWLANG